MVGILIFGIIAGAVINSEYLGSALEENESPTILDTTALIIYGTLISTYVTIVYNRYQRFKSLLRNLSIRRLFHSGYPVSKSDLNRARGGPH